MWLGYALRTITARRSFFNLSTLFSVLSLALGVATLMTAMALINGYEKALKSSVFDAFGHMVLTNSAVPIYGADAEIERINNVIQIPEGTQYSAFVHKEVLAVNQGKLIGALIEGLDLQTYKQVSAIDQRVVQGGPLDLEKAAAVQGSYIGQGLAKTLNIDVGDSLTVVLPFSDEEGNLHRKAQRLEVLGLLDLGKYEFNNRYILMDITSARKFIGFSETASTGLRFKFKQPDFAQKFQTQIMTSEFPYLTQTWKETHSSLFEAIKFEKVVLFLILSIMVIVAAFNLTTGLYLNVYKKTMDVSVLRTLGLKARQVYAIFVIQGLYICLWGYVLGIVFGYVLIFALNFILSSGLFLPPEVYKLNTLVIEPNVWDLVLILVASIVICFVATLSPASKSIQLQPAEGLRYE